MPRGSSTDSRPDRPSDSGVQQIRWMGAASVAGFPPLTREQAVLVRAALRGQREDELVQHAQHS